MDRRLKFADDVLRAYREPSYVAKSNVVHASKSFQRQLEAGHPVASGLEVGEQRAATISSVFLDLSDFTGRTFWDSSDEVARLAHAVLSGFTQIVTELGGHVLGLRGDGMYAGFGPMGDEPGVACAAAGLASAVALDAVENGLNPRLAADGIEPVKARAGIDYGEVTFVRSGIATVNEVNIVGFSANFAAKAEKIAGAWQVVVGQGFADAVGSTDLLQVHEKSPRSFQRNYEVRRYAYYNYMWRRVLSHAEGTVEGLAGRSLEEVSR